MKPVTLTDVAAAARALLAAPRPARKALARRLIAEATAAQTHCVALGRAHPRFGNGSLMAAALAHPVAGERRCDDPDHLDCLLVTLTALRDRPQPRAQDMQRSTVGSSATRRGSIVSPQSAQ